MMPGLVNGHQIRGLISTFRPIASPRLRRWPLLVELQVGDRLKKILGTLKPTIEFRFARTFLPRLRDSDSDSFGTIERASPFQSNRYPTPSRCPADSDHSAAGRR